MDEVFGAETAVHFSPKNLGLNARFLGTEFPGLFSDSLGLNLWTFTGSLELNFLGLFWAVLRLIFGLLLVHVCCFCVLLLKKLLTCWLCKFMLIYAWLMY